MDENGIVTAVKTGYAVITVATADGGFEASCVIRVREPKTTALWKDIQTMILWSESQDPEHYNNWDVMEQALKSVEGVTADSSLEELMAAYQTLRNAMVSLELHVHTTSEVKAQDPTCSETGNTAYYTCVCGRWFLDAGAAMEIVDKDSVVIGKIAHDWADATCTAPKTCKVCGTTEGEALGHTPSDWKSDKDDHWKECACGEKLETAAHTDSDKNGECDVCGHEVPVKDPSSPSTGDASTIVLMAALLFASALALSVIALVAKRGKYSAR